MITLFTPGPWSVSNGDLMRVNAASQEYAWKRPVVVCGVHRIGRFLGKEREGEALANAQLIAAAPDLYSAIEALLESFGHRRDHSIELAKAALAKARGQ